MFTAEQKKKAVERELTYRRRVFGRLVEQKKMTLREAELQIEIFEQIRDDYVRAEEGERLI